jgi:heat shock protein HslJ
MIFHDIRGRLSSGMNKPPSCFLTLPIVATLMLAGCGPQGGNQGAPAAAEAPVAEPPADASVQPAPSWQDAANAAYPGVFDEAVVLKGGQWTGAPYVEGGASAPRAGLAGDLLLQGDVDGDAAEEAVVLLWSSSGGSGTFDYVAVLDRDAKGAVSTVAIAPLGDRVKVRSAAIEDGRIVFDVVQAGPGDAACCPGQNVRRTFAVEGKSMTETSTEDRGRMTLSDLAGEWRLVTFGAEETPPPEVQITVRFENGTVAGGAACNRYTGSVREGEMPGEVSLSGPLALTRMMCPPPLMDWEQRYTAALEGLAQYSFVAGQLILSWRNENESGSLHFVRVTEGEQAGD